MYDGGYDEAEMIAFRPAIWAETLTIIKRVSAAAIKHGIKCSRPKNDVSIH